MGKRKPLSKKIRFEVFKRDSFRCQYCGKSAPDAVLQVDHIKPVSEGGSDDITNLITSCVDCNQGKGNRLLDDKSMLEKQRRQLEELNERRLQLEMMMEWREELMKLENEKINIIKEKWEELTGYYLSKHGDKEIKKLLKRYDMNLVLDSMETSVEQYAVLGNDGKYTHESVEKAFNYIGRICANKQKFEEKPYLKELYYIRGILRNRLHYFDEQKGLKYLIDAYEAGASLESLKEFALSVKNWTSFRQEIEDFINRNSD